METTIKDRTADDHLTRHELSEIGISLMTPEPVEHPDGTRGYETKTQAELAALERDQRHLDACDLCQASMAKLEV